MTETDAKATVAGAYSATKHSGLLGRPLGDAVPADEYLHSPAASGHYSATETSYFGFSIPQRRLNGEVYVWFHPVLKTMSASVYIWTGVKRSTLACEYVNHFSYLPWPADGIADYTIEALNLRIRVLEPLRSIQLDFADSARGVSFSMRQEAIMPPAVRPGGFHFTQAMRVTGDLTLYGDRLKIDGYFSRDRSWGQERREDPMPLPAMSWMVGVFDSTFAFHALAMDDPALGPEWTAAFPHITSGANLLWGYIWKDGELTPLAAARKLTKRRADGLTPHVVDMELADAKGRRFSIHGDIQASMPWQTWQNMNVYFCQTKWTCGTQVGYGDTQDVQFGEFTRRFAQPEPEHVVR